MILARRPYALFDFFNRPSCMFAYGGFRVFKGAIQDRQGIHVAYVAERDRHVTQVTASLGACDGAPLEVLIKLLGCNGQHLGQRWKRVRPEMRRRVVSKSRIPLSCESIPRADHLANVTSKNPTADFFPQFGWDIVFEFDGEIGDAAARVDRAVRKDAIRGAGFDATPAG